MRATARTRQAPEGTSGPIALSCGRRASATMNSARTTGVPATATGGSAAAAGAVADGRAGSEAGVTVIGAQGCQMAWRAPSEGGCYARGIQFAADRSLAERREHVIASLVSEPQHPGAIDVHELSVTLPPRDRDHRILGQARVST